MAWMIILAMLCLIATSAGQNTSSNQTAVNSTSTNMTSTLSTSTNNFSNTSTTSTANNTSSSNTSTTSTANNTSSSNTSTTSTANNTSSSNTSTTSTANNTSSLNTSTTSTANNTSSSNTSTTSTANNTSSSNTSTTSTATNSTSINTPLVPENVTAVFALTFSIDETFDSALANTSSQQFAKKAKNIRSQVEPLYFKAFQNFIRIGILRLSSGSTMVDSNVYFNSSGPNATVSDVKNTFLNGLSILNFTVISNSIYVSQTLGNSMPTLITSSLSMISISLLSLLLSLVFHF